jgi:hypothetical protein
LIDGFTLEVEAAVAVGTTRVAVGMGEATMIGV